MQIEVCVYSLASAITAQHAGADRIELCGGLAEGGTTPSIGLINCVRKNVSIPFFVMIRPRGGDFLYSESEFEVMCADIDAVKDAGADGVVLGLVSPDGTIDEPRTGALVQLARPLPTTFHRAFDMTEDPNDALEAAIRIGATRILTSGQQQKAIDGVSLLHELVKNAAGRIDIMAGSGVSAENASALAATGVQALHLSGSSSAGGGMLYRKQQVSMASSSPGEYERTEADEAKINAVRRMFSSHREREADSHRLACQFVEETYVVGHSHPLSPEYKVCPEDHERRAKRTIRHEPVFDLSHSSHSGSRG
jgi:copper homeostasis protein